MIAIGDNEKFNLATSFKVTKDGEAVKFESVDPLFPDQFVTLKDGKVSFARDGDAEWVPIETKCPD